MEAADARLRFGLFSALFAVALLLHQLWWDGFELWSLHALVALVAVAVLLRPTSVARLLVLLGCEVVAVARDAPGEGSHTLLAAVVAATVLAFVAVEAGRSRRLPGPGELFERCAPFLRWSVIGLYVAAALAKMNSGFFDPAVSCAAAMSSRIAWWDPSLLDAGWLRTFAIYGSLATEVSLPLLLAPRRTRTAGLVLGVGFHLVLALAGNVPFTGLLFALYVAFLPPGVASRARLPAWSPPRWAPPLAVATAVGLWALGAHAEALDPRGAQQAIGNGTRLFLIALVVAGTACMAQRPQKLSRHVTQRLRGSASQVRGLRLGHPVFAVGVALLVANAASPYLGLKTESSMTMFSNLQTEAGYWNHAFVPEAVRVFGDQDHLVTVTASNDPLLLRRTSHGTRMVRFEVERYLRLHPGRWATVAPGRLAAHGPPLAGLVDRVAKFRDVRAPGRRGC